MQMGIVRVTVLFVGMVTMSMCMVVVSMAIV